jgi:hypothetical protein
MYKGSKENCVCECVSVCACVCVCVCKGREGSARVFDMWFEGDLKAF